MDIDTLISFRCLFAFISFCEIFGDLDFFFSVGCGLSDGCRGLLLLDENTSLSIGLLFAFFRLSQVLGNPDFLFSCRLGLANFTMFILHSDVDLGLIDSFCRRLFPDTLNVFRFVRDIGNVNVN